MYQLQFANVESTDLKMRWLLPIIPYLLLCTLVARATCAQTLMAEKDRPEALRVLDSRSKKSLPCFIDFTRNPRLDFLFRYIAGFAIDCNLGKVVQPGAKLEALLRITPKNGQPILMIDKFYVPQVRSDGPTSIYAPLSHLYVSMSGAFALGPGQYLLELVLIDEQGHTCRKQLTLKLADDTVAIHLRVALPRGSAVPLVEARWDGALASKGLRVTVMLHAYSPNGAKLHAADRAYLLQSLAAMLDQLPCQSVKLIAFNLDRQQEIFRQNKFDAGGFLRLEEALKQTELGTIPYPALSPLGWAKFLANMIRGEATSGDSPDAIILLGAWGSHVRDKVPKDLIEKTEGSNRRIFYFEYFRPVSGDPDGVELLTKKLHGAVFAVSSPQTLAQAIQRMKFQTTAPGD